MRSVECPNCLVVQDVQDAATTFRCIECELLVDQVPGGPPRARVAAPREQMSVTCAVCQSRLKLPAEAVAFRCQVCHSDIRFRNCHNCGERWPVPLAWSAFQCRHCQQVTAIVEGIPVSAKRAERVNFISYVLALALIGGLVWGGWAILSNVFEGSSTSGNKAVGEEDAGADLACTHFRNVMGDVAAGLLTDAELREKLKEVHSDASVSDDPEIRTVSTAMVADITRGDADALLAHAEQFSAACARLGL